MAAPWEQYKSEAGPWQSYTADPNAKYKALEKTPKSDVTEEMNILETGAAGLGKAFVDTGRGVKQLLGIGDQEELQRTIDDEKQLSKPLMDTAGGVVGNIGGHVGMAVAPGGALIRAGNLLKAPGAAALGKSLLAPQMTLGGAAIGGGMGALQGGIQSVASDETRTGNMMLPAIGGAALPLLGVGGGLLKGAVEPLYSGGRDRIIGRALNTAAGANAPQAIQNMRGAQVLVPGSQPTAAEVAGSGGIAAMQRAASAVDPEAYATRAAQQNEARVSALQGVSGTPAQRTAAEASRESTAGPLYRQAIQDGADPVMSKVLQPQIKNLLQRMPSGVMEKAQELARLNGEVMGKSGSVQGLHYVKLAVDDLLSSAKQTGIGAQTQRGLVQFKKDLLSVVDDLSPTYGKARGTYEAMSKPVNQMAVGQELAERSINPLTGIMQPASYGRALGDDLAQSATGFNKATLANTMEPQQLGVLGNIKSDLARSVAARDLGRGAGSDTVQKLSMTNLMQQSGLPVGILNAPGVGRLGNWAYAQTDELMKSRLAEALLDPRQTAQIMQAAQRNPQLARAIEEIRRVMAPGILGGALSSNAQQ